MVSPSQCRLARRTLGSRLHGYDRRVAVIGGGITGLTTAYRLSEDPRTHVTLYEKSRRLGGWLQSEHLETNGKRVLFEYGPRTFRLGFPGSVATIELMTDLGLRDDMRIIKQAGARYIYHRDHLERLPGPDRGLFGNLWTLATSPYLRSLVQTCADGYFKKHEHDGPSASLGDYLERQFGRRFVEDFASAVIHGIYAADIYSLDARKVLPGPVALEQHMTLFEFLYRTLGASAVNSDVVTHLLQVQANEARKLPHPMVDYYRASKTGSIFMLQGGMSSLAEKLSRRLTWADNVDIRLGEEVADLAPTDAQMPVQVTTSNGSRKLFDNVVSTTSSAVLQKQLASTGAASHDPQIWNSLNPSVSVVVVNLFYETPGLTPPGFGYLIPESVTYDQNGERALGVIFPPPAEAQQDDSASGTKIGVMLGGRWWSDWKVSEMPDEAEAVVMAQALLQRHLGITEDPVLAKARLQLNCIPQTGSTAALQHLDLLLTALFGGRLSVAGPSYGPPGLNDCIRAGTQTATGILKGNTSTNLDWYYQAPLLLRCHINKKVLQIEVNDVETALGGDRRPPTANSS
ncbi:oxygen-dependent protoporphyrinogen oxidase [Ascosphaera acerosa]|nr:oxygen-dependent protoporphyrinogen oxidase [Ascosphaera acerosa]